MTVKKTGKSTFFIVVAFIALFAVTSVFGIDKLYGDNRTTYVKGVDDIRLGIDIKGGVDVTFAPAGDYDADLHSLTPLPRSSRQDLLPSVSPITRSTAMRKATESSFASRGRSARAISTPNRPSRSSAKWLSLLSERALIRLPTKREMTFPQARSFFRVTILQRQGSVPNPDDNGDPE